MTIKMQRSPTRHDLMRPSSIPNKSCREQPNSLLAELLFFGGNNRPVCFRGAVDGGEYVIEDRDGQNSMGFFIQAFLGKLDLSFQ